MLFVVFFFRFLCKQIEDRKCVHEDSLIMQPLLHLESIDSNLLQIYKVLLLEVYKYF
jgi:hypothetical protein